MAAVCATACAPSSRTGRRARRSATASGVRPPAGAAGSSPGAAGSSVCGARSAGARLPAGGLSSINATTGPAGAASARRTARTASWLAWSPPTVSTALATERPSAPWSSRWWLTRPASAARTVSATTTSGSRSSAAWAIPLTALASPGPRVTSTAPGAPVRSAVVAAMMAAAVSVWVSTKRSPAAAAAPTTSRLGPPPGTPNIIRVPAEASAATIAVAPDGPAAAWRGPLRVAAGRSPRAPAHCGTAAHCGPPPVPE